MSSHANRSQHNGCVGFNTVSFEGITFDTTRTHQQHFASGEEEGRGWLPFLLLGQLPSSLRGASPKGEEVHIIDGTCTVMALAACHWSAVRSRLSSFPLCSSSLPSLSMRCCSYRQNYCPSNTFREEWSFVPSLFELFLLIVQSSLIITDAIRGVVPIILKISLLLAVAFSFHLNTFCPLNFIIAPFFQSCSDNINRPRPLFAPVPLSPLLSSSFRPAESSQAHLLLDKGTRFSQGTGSSEVIEVDSVDCIFPFETFQNNKIFLFSLLPFSFPSLHPFDNPFQTFTRVKKSQTTPRLSWQVRGDIGANDEEGMSTAFGCAFPWPLSSLCSFFGSGSPPSSSLPSMLGLSLVVGAYAQTAPPSDIKFTFTLSETVYTTLQSQLMPSWSMLTSTGAMFTDTATASTARGGIALRLSRGVRANASEPLQRFIISIENCIFIRSSITVLFENTVSMAGGTVLTGYEYQDAPTHSNIAITLTNNKFMELGAGGGSSSATSYFSAITLDIGASTFVEDMRVSVAGAYGFLTGSATDAALSSGQFDNSSLVQLSIDDGSTLNASSIDLVNVYHNGTMVLSVDAPGRQIATVGSDSSGGGASSLKEPWFGGNAITVTNASSSAFTSATAVVRYNFGRSVANSTFAHATVCVMASFTDGPSNPVLAGSMGGARYGVCEASFPLTAMDVAAATLFRYGAVIAYKFSAAVPSALLDANRNVSFLSTAVSQNTFSSRFITAGQLSRAGVSVACASRYRNGSNTVRFSALPPSMVVSGNLFETRNVTLSAYGSSEGNAVEYVLRTATRKTRVDLVQPAPTLWSGDGTEYRGNTFRAYNTSCSGRLSRALAFNATVVDVDAAALGQYASVYYMSGVMAYNYGMMSPTAFADNALVVGGGAGVLPVALLAAPMTAAAAGGSSGGIGSLTRCSGGERCIAVSIAGYAANFTFVVLDVSMSTDWSVQQQGATPAVSMAVQHAFLSSTVYAARIRGYSYWAGSVAVSFLYGATVMWGAFTVRDIYVGAILSGQGFALDGAQTMVMSACTVSADNIMIESAYSSTVVSWNFQSGADCLDTVFSVTNSRRIGGYGFFSSIYFYPTSYRCTFIITNNTNSGEYSAGLWMYPMGGLHTSLNITIRRFVFDFGTTGSPMVGTYQAIQMQTGRMTLSTITIEDVTTPLDGVLVQFFDTFDSNVVTISGIKVAGTAANTVLKSPEGGGVRIVTNMNVQVRNSIFTVTRVSVIFPAVLPDGSVPPYIYGVMVSSMGTESSTSAMRNCSFAITKVTVDALIVTMDVLEYIFNPGMSFFISPLPSALGGDAVALMRPRYSDASIASPDPEWAARGTLAMDCTFTIDSVAGGIDARLYRGKGNRITISRAVGFSQKSLAAQSAGDKLRVNTSNTIHLHGNIAQTSEASTRPRPAPSPTAVYYSASNTVTLLGRIFNYALLTVRGPLWRDVLLSVSGSNGLIDLTRKEDTSSGGGPALPASLTSAGSEALGLAGYGLVINCTVGGGPPASGGGVLSIRALKTPSILVMGVVASGGQIVFGESEGDDGRIGVYSKLSGGVATPSVGPLNPASPAITTAGMAFTMSAVNCTAEASCLVVVSNAVISSTAVSDPCVDVKSGRWGAHSMLLLWRTAVTMWDASIAWGAVLVQGADRFADLSQFSIIASSFTAYNGKLSVCFVGDVTSNIALEIWGNIFSKGGIAFPSGSALITAIITNNTFANGAVFSYTGYTNSAGETAGTFIAGCNRGLTPAMLPALVFPSQVQCFVDNNVFTMNAGQRVIAHRCDRHLSFFGADTPRDDSFFPTSRDTNAIGGIVPCHITAATLTVEQTVTREFSKSRTIAPKKADDSPRTETATRSMTATVLMAEGSPSSSATRSVVAQSSPSSSPTSTLAMGTATLSLALAPPPRTASATVGEGDLTHTLAAPRTVTHRVRTTKTVEVPLLTDSTTTSVPTNVTATLPSLPMNTTAPANTTFRPIPTDAPLVGVLAAAEKATSAVGVVLAVSSAVSVTGGQLGVANAMVRLATCDGESDDDGDDGDLPILVHPLRFAFGPSIDDAYAAAALSNTIIVPCIVGVAAVGPIAWVVGLVRGGGMGRREVLTSLGWPSLLVLPFATLAEGIGVSIVRSLRSSCALGVGMGVVALIPTCGFVLAWLWVLLRVVPRSDLRLAPTGSALAASAARKRKERLNRMLATDEIGVDADDTAGDIELSPDGLHEHHPQRRRRGAHRQHRGKESAFVCLPNSITSSSVRLVALLEWLVTPTRAWAPRRMPQLLLPSPHQQPDALSTLGGAAVGPSPLLLASSPPQGYSAGGLGGAAMAMADPLLLNLDTPPPIGVGLGRSPSGDSVLVGRQGSVGSLLLSPGMTGRGHAVPMSLSRSGDASVDTPLRRRRVGSTASVVLTPSPVIQHGGLPPSALHSPAKRAKAPRRLAHPDGPDEEATNAANRATTRFIALQYALLEQYGNGIGDKRIFYAEFVSFVCGLAVGCTEGVEPSTSDGCRSRAVVALFFAILQALCSITALVPVELFLQLVLSLCIVPLSIVVTAKVFMDDDSDGDRGTTMSSANPFMGLDSGGLDRALSALSLLSNVVGLFLMGTGLLLALKGLLTASRPRLMAELRHKAARRAHRGGGDYAADGEGDDDVEMLEAPEHGHGEEEEGGPLHDSDAFGDHASMVLTWQRSSPPLELRLMHQSSSGDHNLTPPALAVRTTPDPLPPPPHLAPRGNKGRSVGPIPLMAALTAPPSTAAEAMATVSTCVGPPPLASVPNGGRTGAAGGGGGGGGAIRLPPRSPSQIPRGRPPPLWQTAVLDEIDAMLAARGRQQQSTQFS